MALKIHVIHYDMQIFEAGKDWKGDCYTNREAGCSKGQAKGKQIPHPTGWKPVQSKLRFI
jgi:hypothetical protein